VTWQARVYKILIASPRDLEKERKVISEVIHEWNDLHADKNCVMLQAIMWEKHTTPELGNRPQEIVNKQIVEDCDILIGTFWIRLGTPTGVAESGTIEEIEKFDSAKKPVLLYFSTRLIPPDSIDSKQLEQLREKKKEYQKRGLISSYKSIPDLRKKLGIHIERTIQKLQASTSQTGKEPESPEKNRNLTLNTLKSKFQTFFIEYEKDWTSERNSNPRDNVEGHRLLRHVKGWLNNMKQEYKHLLDSQQLTKIKKIIGASESIRKEGRGDSGSEIYKLFWGKGDQILHELREILNDLKKRTIPEVFVCDGAFKYRHVEDLEREHPNQPKYRRGRDKPR
jgi:hypothetical protein